MSDRDVVQFECPRCLSNVRAGKRDVGKLVECEKCGQSLQVPPTSSTGPSAFDDLFGDTPTEAATNDEITISSAVDGDTGSIESGIDDFSFDDGHGASENVTEDLLPSEPVAALGQVGDEPGLELGPDDLIPLESEPFELGFKADETNVEPISGEDPFKEREDLSPLKVDGITTDGIDADELRGIKCEICDTRIHINESQTDGHVECPVCFSKVEIQPDKPLTQRDREWRKQAMAPEVEKTDEKESTTDQFVEASGASDDGYGLAPLDDDLLRPAADMLFPDGAPEQFKELTQSSMEITEDDLIEEDLAEANEPAFDPNSNYDDVAMLAEQHHDPQLADDEEPIGLVSSDLGLPHTEETQVFRPRKTKDRNRDSAAKPRENKPATKPKSAKKASRRDRLEQAKEPDDADGITSIDDDVSDSMDMTPFTFGTLAARIQASLSTPGFLWRVAIAIGVLSAACCFYIFAAAITEKAKVEEIAVSMKVTRFVFTMVFTALWILGSIFLWYIASMLFRDNALGKTSVTSWKHQGFSDIQSTVLLFVFSFLIAGLPMLMFGPSIVNPFRILLATPMLLSAWYNRSPFMIIAIDAFKAKGNPIEEWTVFAGAVFALFLICLVGGLLYLFPFSIIAFLATVIQAFAICGFAAISGWHVGRIVCRLQSE